MVKELKKQEQSDEKQRNPRTSSNKYHWHDDFQNILMVLRNLFLCFE